MILCIYLFQMTVVKKSLFVQTRKRNKKGTQRKKTSRPNQKRGRIKGLNKEKSRMCRGLLEKRKQVSSLQDRENKPNNRHEAGVLIVKVCIHILKLKEKDTKGVGKILWNYSGKC